MARIVTWLPFSYTYIAKCYQKEYLPLVALILHKSLYEYLPAIPSGITALIEGKCFIGLPIVWIITVVT